MNSREAADLDRYITGNYGEDQFAKPIRKPRRRYACHKNTMAGAAERSQAALPGAYSMVLCIETDGRTLETPSPWIKGSRSMVKVAQQCAAYYGLKALAVSPKVSLQRSAFPYLWRVDLRIEIAD